MKLNKQEAKKQYEWLLFNISDSFLGDEHQRYWWFTQARILKECGYWRYFFALHKKRRKAIDDYKRWKRDTAKYIRLLKHSGGGRHAQQ